MDVTLGCGRQGWSKWRIHKGIIRLSGFMADDIKGVLKFAAIVSEPAGWIAHKK
jgi:hypothetical protein